MKIDVLEPLELQPNTVERFTNALGRLQRLAVGLGYLYGNVRQSELVVYSRIQAEHGDVHAEISGNHPILNEAPMALIECAFHWYAVSLVNFVRATSAMALEGDNVARKSYQEKVLGHVAPFRDKIAAHFAGMTRNENDKDAERFVSLIPSVSWSGERFVAGGWAAHIRRGNVTSDSKAMGAWRLTEMHEGLCERYPLICEFTSKKNDNSP